MKKIVFVFLLSLSCFHGYSQGLYSNNWCFGDSAGLNFNSGNPQPFVSSLKSQAACASISDSLGNLLFYTNGIKVWDKNHNQMPNGYGLYAIYESPNYGSNVSGGTLIIPYPQQPYKFLIFTSSNLLDTGFHYSIVNMLLNGGNGDVEFKNFHLYHQQVYQPITAVRHANGRDWWVIAHKMNGDSFYWFLVNPQGVDGPFVQHIGPIISNGGFDLEGASVVSNDGNKLLMVCQRSIDIYDINRCEGKLENHISILYFNMGYAAYGGAFSPNGNLIYATAKGDTLFQYNLNDAPDSIYIKRKLIYENLHYLPSGFNGYPLNGLRLGNDDKLYFTMQYELYPSVVFDSINTTLSVINYPDSIGAACGLSINSIDLGGRRCFVDLPNMPNYNLGALIGSPCDTLSCVATLSSQILKLCEGDSIYLAGAYQITAGTYYDTLSNASGCDSVVTTLLSMQPSVNATVTQATDTLTAQATGVTYQWYNCDNSSNIAGATNQGYTVIATAHYAVWVTDANGCSKLSACLFVEVNGINELVTGSGFIIYPNPANEKLTIEVLNGVAPKKIEIVNAIGVTVIKLHQSKPNQQVNIKALAAGVYFVKLQMPDGSVTVKRFVKE